LSVDPACRQAGLGFELCFFIFDFSIKTTFLECVTCRANLTDFDEQRITIAIKPDSLNVLKMTGGFSLDPECLPRSGPIACLAGFKRGLKGINIHVSHHQDIFSLIILDNYRDQPVFIKTQFMQRAFSNFDCFNIFIIAHCRTCTPLLFKNCFTSPMVISP
jgi:hypothetical protein